MNLVIERWLREAITFYRPRGFFCQLQGDTNVVVSKLMPYLTTQYSGDAITMEDLESPEFDLFLLSCDPFRSLYDGMEFGDFLAPGNDAYVATVNALAKVSRGTFIPKDVKEEWETEEGPIKISFEFEGRPRTLKVDLWDGMFDFRLLLQLNQLLWKTEFRFEMAPMDDILFVTVLKAEEKTDMERERGVSFMVLDLPRSFHPVHRFAPPLELPEDPEEPTFYIGTLNENLDRCIGRLRFILRGTEAEGHHLFQGEAHQEDFNFVGTLDKETKKFTGTLSGHITVGNEMRAYEGKWRGTLAKGNRVATGSWQGWFAKDRPLGEERPEDPSLVYKGQWGLLEEDFSQTDDPYIERVRAWLENVWQSKNIDDYPWLLPSD